MRDREGLFDVENVDTPRDGMYDDERLILKFMAGGVEPLYDEPAKLEYLNDGNKIFAVVRKLWSDVSYGEVGRTCMSNVKSALISGKRTRVHTALADTIRRAYEKDLI